MLIAVRRDNLDPTISIPRRVAVNGDDRAAIIEVLRATAHDFTTPFVISS